MGDQADVVIIGLGTGGEDLALRLLDAGQSVIGIESQLLGGECPFWACIPSKMMIRAANLLHDAGRVGDGVGGDEAAAHWATLATRIRQEATADWDDSIAVSRFEDRGGTFLRGRGRFTGPTTVAVGDEEVTATRGIVVATGSQPAIPPVPGLADVDYWTTHEAIAAEQPPGSMIVLGGGVVGCELGQVFSRFGTDVTLVDGHDRPLSREEPEAGTLIADVFGREGITVETGRAVDRVHADGDAIAVTLESGAKLSAERLLVATGRRVDLDGLGLETTDVDASSGFVAVDGHLRAAEGIWAMGDVTGKAMFTHVALYQGSIVAADLLGEDPAPAEYHAVPRVIFTDPEVGAVGMTEAQAREAGLDVGVVTKPVPATFRGWLQGAGNDGVVKLVVDRGGGVLVGATTAGPDGGEVLSMLALAVHDRIPLSTLRRMIYPFPTFYGAIGEALGAYGRGTGTVLDPVAEPLLDP
jgi:pyruvate/2-oxoglutarate dehydrogenase complex dihydrolipoamide dehydrogenase (E3) component